MSTSEKSLSAIFCAAGAMIPEATEFIESGEFPAKRFYVRWIHENGIITYDGESWIYEPAERIVLEDIPF